MKLSIVLSTHTAQFQAVAFKGDFEANVAKITGWGYDGVELAIRDPKLVDADELLRVVTGHGLEVPAIGTGQAWGEEGLSFTDPDPEVRAAAIQRVCDHVPFAARAGAVIIIGLLRGIVKPGVSHDQAYAWLVEALQRCSAAAAPHGVRLVLEPINRYETTLINNVEQGLALIEDVGADNFGLLLDTFHMNIEEPVIEDSIRACGDRIFHFHVADSNRWYPGAGHLDFKSILDALFATGYRGYISGEFMPLPDADTAAQRGLAHLRGLYSMKTERSRTYLPIFKLGTMTYPKLTGFTLYPNSVTETEDATYFLARGPNGKVLGIIGNAAGFEGQRQGEVTLCPLTADNAAALRNRLPWLRPQPLGLQTSVGCGDRLGLATPGHVRAVRKAAGIAPIFAQQSMRENARTGRTPQQVMDDAMWGVFQEGWRDPWGADADHLKTTEDIDLCVAAGYTFFTVDPGDYVDNAIGNSKSQIPNSKFTALPWAELEDTPDDLRRRYLGRRFEVETFTLEFDEPALLRAACKYGRAIAHTVRMYRHLAAQSDDFEFEMSVDETETPTSIEEHFFIASELKRLGVRWVSLAPRFVGRFEKGVDYIGDLTEFEAQFAKHAAIARVLGPYKLSIHSGSDKFSIYPIAARQTRGLVHLKTAGTSFLEALRTVAQVKPALFREILAYARLRYDADRATYHVSAQLTKVPTPEALSDADLPGLLAQFDARQVLHVTFGSVLDRFGDQLLTALRDHEAIYYRALESHFQRHLSSFVGAKSPSSPVRW
jgi:sugar phosphate isomerase/epimerase